MQISLMLIADYLHYCYPDKIFSHYGSIYIRDNDKSYSIAICKDNTIEFIKLPNLELSKGYSQVSALWLNCIPIIQRCYQEIVNGTTGMFVDNYGYICVPINNTNTYNQFDNKIDAFNFAMSQKGI